MSGINETFDVSKISALSRVCEKFMAACVENGITALEAYTGIGRLLGFGTQRPSSESSSVQTPIAVRTTVVRELTKDEADQARKGARTAKAVRLGLTQSEVNLTPEEARAALAAMRDKLSRVHGEPIYRPAPPVRHETTSQDPWAFQGFRNNLPETPKRSPVPARHTLPPYMAAGSDPTGERSTALTRIKDLRAKIIRKVPWSLLGACGLHMVEYSNSRFVLARQWDTFQRTYSFDGLKDPLRGLPDAWDHELTRPYMEGLVKGLKTQASEPDIYILQASSSESYWDGDKPSRFCPYSLRLPIPDYIIDIMRHLAFELGDE